MKNPDARLLIVDDDDNNRYLLSKLLEREGYRSITMAEDGLQALDLLERQDIDLVLLDIQMPRMDGHQVLKHMKTDGDLSSIPVIVITVLDDVQNAVRCIELGADDYLPIPYNPVILRARVHASLERRRLRQAEKANLARTYRGLTDLTMDGIVIADMSGRIGSVNSAAEKIFARSSAELQGTGFQDLVANWPATSAWEELVTGSHVEASVELTGQRPDETFSLQLTAQKLTASEATCVVIHVRDLTEREAMRKRRLELEQQLIQAQKMESVGRLAGGVAHDFNNLLSVIGGYCELLEADDTPASNHASALQQINGAVDMGSKLTQELLTFSRHQVTEAEVTDINAKIEELRPVLEPLLGDTVELSLNLSPAVRDIVVDRSQFERVIMNLVVNANDAMPDGGHVRIGTSEIRVVAGEIAILGAGAYVRVDVADTGAGIDESIRNAIFEPFFTTKEVGHGTGLGLAMAFGILQQNGGTITVDSELGAGSTFHLYLPIAHTDKMDESTAAVQVLESDVETLLIVEDNRAIRVLMEETLNPLGYNVIAADSAHAAMRALDESDATIQMLITDIVMSGMSGPELAKEIGQRCPGVPVLFISGFAERPEATRSLPQEARYLGKPFSPAELGQTVREMLDAAPR